MKRFLGFALIVLTSVATASAAAPAAGTPVGADYHVIKKVVLGGEGGWDYLICDSAARRYYISRSTHVLVVDADTLAQVGDIPDTPGVHGIALAPGLGRGFTSNGKGDSVGIFDLKTLKRLGTVAAGHNPDAIVYDPFTQRVFAFNGKSGDATAIDAASGTVVGTIALGGKPEFAAADGHGYVYVNIEDKNEGVALNAKTLKVGGRAPYSPCEEPSGLAMDTTVHHRRLFIGCHNKMMAVLDADKAVIVSTPAIGAGVDANAFDHGTGLAFSSNGDGTLTIVHEDAPGVFNVVANVPTQKGARTMALDDMTHHILLVTADFGPAPAATKEQPRPRPPVLPGTFTLLLVGTEAPSK